MRRLLICLLMVACGSGSRSVAPIRLEEVVSLGDATGPGALPNWPRVSALHPGGFRVVIPQLSEGEGVPLVFDAKGNFIGSLAAPGDTGARFQVPRFARFGPGDSVWVFDAARRVLVFGPDRHYVRTIVLQLDAWDGQILPDGRLVVSSAYAAEPIRILSPTGQTQHELASPDSIAGVRRLFLGPDGTIWSLLMQYRWRLEQWDTTGTRLSVMDRSPTWYQPYDRFVGPSPGTPPSPTLIDGWFDATGRLWVLGKAADPQWQKGLAQTGDSADAAVAIADGDKTYDTILEVFDPATGKLTAEARFDVSYPFGVEPGMVARVLDEADGRKKAVIMRVVLDTTKK